MKYRIVEANYANGTKWYHVQKQVRLFFFGPLIWKTYSGFDDGYGDQWSFSLENGVNFETTEEALEFINELKIQEGGWKVISSKIIKEC